MVSMRYTNSITDLLLYMVFYKRSQFGYIFENVSYIEAQFRYHFATPALKIHRVVIAVVIICVVGGVVVMRGREGAGGGLIHVCRQHL